MVSVSDVSPMSSGALDLQGNLQNGFMDLHGLMLHVSSTVRFHVFLSVIERFCPRILGASEMLDMYINRNRPHTTLGRNKQSELWHLTGTADFIEKQKEAIKIVRCKPLLGWQEPSFDS